MEKRLKQSLGIDVSKLKLSLSLGFLTGKLEKEFISHEDVSNDMSGYKELLKWLKKSVDATVELVVVMEATGDYHYRLAQFLYKNGVTVSVVNPLSVKRFIQMKLAKIKTDKSDAKAICEYALINEVPIYTALTDVQSECLQLFRLLDSYLKKRTATKNKMHGEEALGLPSKFVYRSLRRNRKHLDKEVKGIEEKLHSLVKQD